MKRRRARSSVTLYSRRVGGVRERRSGSTSQTIRSITGKSGYRRRGRTRADAVIRDFDGSNIRIRGGMHFVAAAFNKLHPRGAGGRFVRKR